MKLFTGKAAPVQFQWMMWIFLFVIHFFAMLSKDGWLQAAVYTSMDMGFYAVIIYGNIYFLMPRLYGKRHMALYILSSFVMLSALVVGDIFFSMFVYNHLFANKPEHFTVRSLIYLGCLAILVYLFSFIFRAALAYFTLKQQAEEMAAQKSQAELNLLKSQVQPHFLFNTLNNIYYEAYREAPRTALLIERLSEIMRYFVDESPKEEVSLVTEVQFLENYIALEKIRIRYELDLVFDKDYQPESRVPPMLLMPFVENIFKHGIDKSSRDNKIRLSLVQQEGWLVFRTENRLYPSPEGPGRCSGIANLRKRLGLLFGTDFELDVHSSGTTFTAFLKIPTR